VHCYAAFVINDGSAGETEPDLARLAALLEETESALVVEGSHFDARHRKAIHVLARGADPAALAELRSALRCVPGAERRALMMPGEPTVALFAAGRQYLAAVTVVGSHHLRSHGLVDGDVELAEPERLIRWLALTTGNAGFAER
jgi:hypothetical protein